MSDEEKIQRIIRLKRHEKPREGYFEDFLEEFRDRRDQEAGATPPGAGRRTLAAWFRGRGSSGWVLGSGVAYAALVIVIVWWPKGPEADRDQNKLPVIYEPVSQPAPVIPGPAVPLPKKEF